MSTGSGLQQRAEGLVALSTVFRSLFCNPDSAAVDGYLKVLHQTQLLSYQPSAAHQALRGSAEACTLLLPGLQRVTASIERDNVADQDTMESHTALVIQRGDGSDLQRWVVVKSEDASGFNFDFGQEPGYEDHSQYLHSHQGPELLKGIMAAAGLPKDGHPLGLLAILFVCFHEQEVLEMLDSLPEFDEEPDSGDTMKMGWPELVAQSCLQDLTALDSDL